MSAIRQKKQSLSSKKKWVPHNYQKFCVLSGIIKKYLAYFLDPGLGKTSIIIHLYQLLRKYKLAKGVLVVAPLRPAYMVWPKEVVKWKNFSDVSVAVLHDQWDFPKQLTIKKKFDVYVINPEGLKWLYTYLKSIPKSKWPFDVLVVDESTKFKNMSSTRFKLIKAMVPAFNRRYILTGTPIPNGIPNIQGQMYIVDAGESFGSTLKGFRDNYLKQVGKKEWNQWEVRDKQHEDAIYKKISKYAIRLEAIDHLDLPEKTENIIWVDLPKKARKYYEEIENELFTIIEGKDVDTPTAASVAQKCWQIANGALYHDQDPLQKPIASIKREFFEIHDAKLDALEDLIEELGGKPVLVAYNFVHDLKRLKKRFGNKLVSLDSGTTIKQSLKIEKDWNNGKIKILAAYPGTNALGLNLQECGSDVVWFSLTYDQEADDQFLKRIWRQGMKGEVVRNHRIVSKNTIDEAILKSLTSKDKTQQSMLSVVKKYTCFRNK